MDSELTQFKSLVELGEYIKQFDGFRARPIRKGEHPTLYREEDIHNANIHGVRYRDYLFDVDGRWVLPHDQKGLSFSETWKHLSGVYKMFHEAWIKHLMFIGTFRGRFTSWFKIRARSIS